MPGPFDTARTVFSVASQGSRYLSPLEVAQHLGVQVETVRDWIRRGELRAVRLGRLLRVRREDLEAWLSQRVVGSAT